MLRAYGKWVHVENLRLRNPDLSLEVAASGVYAEDGGGIQKIGYSRGRVLSVGHEVTDLKPGAYIAYRGYIQGAFPGLGRNDCFLNIDSVEMEVLDLTKIKELYEVESAGLSAADV